MQGIYVDLTNQDDYLDINFEASIILLQRRWDSGKNCLQSKTKILDIPNLNLHF